MPTELLETTDIDKAIKEEQAASGRVEVRFFSMNPFSQASAQQVFDQLWQSSVDVKRVYIHNRPGLPYLGVVYNRPAATDRISALPVAIIPLIAFGLIASLVGIGIFKVEEITNNLAKLLLIIFGGTILVAVLVRKPLEAAATGYVKRYGG